MDAELGVVELGDMESEAVFGGVENEGLGGLGFGVPGGVTLCMRLHGMCG
jgi:hypothetical protein